MNTSRYTSRYTNITKHFDIERDYSRGFRLVDTVSGRSRTDWTFDTDHLEAYAATEEAIIAERAAKPAEVETTPKTEAATTVTTEATTEAATKPAATPRQIAYIQALLDREGASYMAIPADLTTMTRAYASAVITSLTTRY